MMRKSPFRSVTKPLQDDGTGFYARRNGLSGTPDTSGRHDGGVLTVRQNAFSCPVIMFPQHCGMAFTGMCFNLKLLIAGTLHPIGKEEVYLTESGCYECNVAFLF